MNLLLFETLQGDMHPVGEKDSDDHEVSAGRGRVGQLKRSIHETYRNLVSKLPYHERLCSQLRHSPELTIYHAPGSDPAEARRQLHQFMRSCVRKHTLWAWIDGLGAILGIVVAPLPGPNVLSYYLAARGLGHYLARIGSRRVLAGEDVHFQVEPLIDDVQNHLRENPQETSASLSELEQRYNLSDLDRLLQPLKEHARE